MVALSVLAGCSRSWTRCGRPCAGGAMVGRGGGSHRPGAGREGGTAIMPPLYELRARREPALAERILGYVRRVPGRTISEFLIEAALRFGRLVADDPGVWPCHAALGPAQERGLCRLLVINRRRTCNPRSVAV